MSDSKCNVCNNEPIVGVACVPGMPVSVAYGAKCLKANAHPYGLVVANTAMCGGLEHTAEWWQELVRDTLNHLGKSMERFTSDVAKDIKEFEEQEL